MSGSEGFGEYAYPPVGTLDCPQLRLIATWAANVAEGTFEYDGAAGGEARLRLAAPGSEPGDQIVTIPAYTRQRGSDLASVSFEVPVGDGGVVSREVSARTYNAAFWSESAVEKFLVPYVAMLGGAGAARLLDELMQVWNHYPAALQVVGILHRSEPGAAGSVSFHALFDVLYVEGNDPKVVSFAEFQRLGNEIGWAPTAKPPVIPTLPFRRGTVALDAPQLPSELTLRRMAEYASEYREQPVYILFDVERGTYDRNYGPLPLDLDGLVVVPAFTPHTRADRPAPTQVVLRGDSGPLGRIGEEGGDALFWGSGAVEHILSPYYVSTYGRAALPELRRITDDWWGIRGEELVMGDPEGMTDVFALVHLPKSDWDPELGPEVVIQQEVRAIRRNPGGVARREPLRAGLEPAAG